jgi:hypothetical protein
VGGVDLPLSDEDVSAFGELVGADAHVGGHREGGAAIAGDAPAELAKSPSVRAVRCSQRSVPGKERTSRTGLRDVARRTRRAGVRALARRRGRWRHPRSSTGVSNNSNASALPCSGVVTSASIEVVAVCPPRTRHHE